MTEELPEAIVPAVTSLPDEVAAILAFHGTPVAAQVLREVLGMLGRTAEQASRRMPKNRPAELRGKGWEKSSLLALADLCHLLAPEVGTINAPREDPDAWLASLSTPETVTIGGSGDGIDVIEAPTEREVRETEQRAEVDRIEAALRAEQAEKKAALTAMQDKINETVEHLAAISPNGHEPEQMTAPERAAGDYLPPVHAPDPWTEPESEAIGQPVNPWSVHAPDPAPLDGPPF